MKRGTLVLRDEAQAKAYLHPVRIRILELLADRPLTLTMVARALAVHPANLTYQFKKLVAAKLIELVEERDTGRVVEKYYRAAATSFEVRRNGATRSHAGQRALRVLRDDVARAIPTLGDDSPVLALLARVRLSARALEVLRARLEAVVQEVREAREDPGGTEVTLNVSLYPRTTSVVRKAPSRD